MDNFSICLDDFDKQAIRETFAALIESVLAALSLSMEADVDPLLTKIGEVIYLIDLKAESQFTRSRLVLGQLDYR